MACGLDERRLHEHSKKNYSATYVRDPSVGFVSVIPSLQFMPYLSQIHLRTIDHSDNVSGSRGTRHASIEFYILL